VKNLNEQLDNAAILLDILDKRADAFNEKLRQIIADNLAAEMAASGLSEDSNMHTSQADTLQLKGLTAQDHPSELTTQKTAEAKEGEQGETGPLSSK